MDRAARNTKGGREMNVDTGCKVRKVTWTLPPLLTREQSPTDAASTPFCLRHFFFLRDLCQRALRKGKRKGQRVDGEVEKKRSERLERMREMGGARRLLAPSDVRLARVLVAHDSSHLGKS